MAVTKWTSNYGGWGELLRSPAIQAILAEKARRIQAGAGPGMEMQVGVGRDRARAMVWTGTHAARVAEATGRALTISFGSNAR